MKPENKIPIIRQLELPDPNIRFQVSYYGELSRPEIIIVSHRYSGMAFNQTAIRIIRDLDSRMRKLKYPYQEKDVRDLNDYLVQNYYPDEWYDAMDFGMTPSEIQDWEDQLIKQAADEIICSPWDEEEQEKKLEEYLEQYRYNHFNVQGGL